ncbi:MAG: hypothetical protein QXP36_09340, partial [Conexivisphaerales archaeon]
LLPGSSFVVLIDGTWLTLDELYDYADQHPEASIYLRGVEVKNGKIDWQQSAITIDKVKAPSYKYIYTFNDLFISVTQATLLAKLEDKFTTVECGKNMPLEVLALKTLLTVERPTRVDLVQLTEEVDFYVVDVKDPVYIFVGAYNKLFKNYSIAICAR